MEPLRLHAGGAGGLGASPIPYVVEGCASLGVNFVLSYALDAIFSLLWRIANAGDSDGALLAITVVSSLVSLFLIPLATAGTVTWLARMDGRSPSFGRVYVASLVSRVLFVGTLPVLLLTTLDSPHNYALLYLVVAGLGIVVPPVVEVVAANSGFGGGGDARAPARVPAPRRAEADRPPGTARMAPALTLAAFAF